jgi:AhpD family alkylhydroperoxidase
MSYLTAQQRALVAIGASLASNCIPCIKFHVKNGLQADLSRDAIAEAIEVAEAVRQVPARNVREAATAALDHNRARPTGVRGESACSATDDASVSNGTMRSSCCGQKPNHE